MKVYCFVSSWLNSPNLSLYSCNIIHNNIWTYYFSFYPNICNHSSNRTHVWKVHILGQFWHVWFVCDSSISVVFGVLDRIKSIWFFSENIRIYPVIFLPPKTLFIAEIMFDLIHIQIWGEGINLFIIIGSCLFSHKHQI